MKLISMKSTSVQSHDENISVDFHEGLDQNCLKWSEFLIRESVRSGRYTAIGFLPDCSASN